MAAGFVSGIVNAMVFVDMMPGLRLASGWGARLSLRTDKKMLKRAYAGFLVIVTGYMIYKLLVSLGMVPG